MNTPNYDYLLPISEACVLLLLFPVLASPKNRKFGDGTLNYKNDNTQASDSGVEPNSTQVTYDWNFHNYTISVTQSQYYHSCKGRERKQKWNLGVRSHAQPPAKWEVEPFWPFFESDSLV